MRAVPSAALAAALALAAGAVPGAGASAEETPAQAEARRALMTEGSRVWSGGCSGCHAARPTAGAPFGLRVTAMSAAPEGGVEGLIRRAIAGVPGAVPMPPRGGDPALTDDEVKAAAVFMMWMNGGRGPVEDWLQSQE